MKGFNKVIWFHTLTFLKPKQWLIMSRVNKCFYQWIISSCDTHHFPLWKRFRENRDASFWYLPKTTLSCNIARHLFYLKSRKTESLLGFLISCLLPFNNASVFANTMTRGEKNYKRWNVFINNLTFGIFVVKHKSRRSFSVEIENWGYEKTFSRKQILKMIDSFLSMEKNMFFDDLRSKKEYKNLVEYLESDNVYEAGEPIEKRLKCIRNF